MNTPEDTARCPGCGLVVQTRELAAAPGGPAAAGCFALFGELLAASYTDPARRALHQLIVDAYTAQHAGGASRREVQAVAICLMTLHLFLERGIDPRQGPALHKTMVGGTVAFRRLEPPPPEDGAPTVADVLSPDEGYEQRVTSWAEAVWSTWIPHHETVRAWTRTALEDAG